MRSQDDFYMEGIIVRGLISAYPKSGSTWLKFLLCNIMHERDDHNFGTATTSIPCLGTPEMQTDNRLHSGIYRTHELISLQVPKIYLCRNVLDVLISFYYHNVKFYAYAKDMESFVEALDYGKDWRDHIDFFIDREKSPCFRYEDMLDDPSSNLMRICSLLHIDCSLDSINKSVERSNLARMSNIENQQGLGVLCENGRPDIPFVRTDARKNLLSPRTIDKILTINSEHLKKIDYAAKLTRPRQGVQP